MNQISECCDAPLVYHIWERSDKSIGYEPWDFCPECLECCSGYDPKDRDKENRMKQLIEGANDDTIKRSHKRLAKELGFGRRNDAVNSSNDSVYNGLLQESHECFT